MNVQNIRENPKNPKKSQEIPRNPKKSQKIPRNPKKSQEIPRNPKKSQENPKKIPRKIWDFLGIWESQKHRFSKMQGKSNLFRLESRSRSSTRPSHHRFIIWNIDRDDQSLKTRFFFIQWNFQANMQK